MAPGLQRVCPGLQRLLTLSCVWASGPGAACPVPCGLGSVSCPMFVRGSFLTQGLCSHPGTLHRPLKIHPEPQRVTLLGKLRVRLCDPMNRSTPGLPVHHQLPEFTQTHVPRVSDAIQPSHPLSSPSPAPNPQSGMDGRACYWEGPSELPERRSSSSAPRRGKNWK